MNIAEIRAKFPQYADVPDGELVRGLHRKHYADIPYAAFLKQIDFRKAVDPTEGMGGMAKFNAGAGKALMDIGQGAAQMVGMGPNAEEVRNRRELDKPLMNTGAGMAGNVGMTISGLAPLAMVPGGSSILGAGALAAGVGALQPTESATDRLVNMGSAGLMGAGVQTAAGPGARMLGEWGADRMAGAALRKSQNAVRDSTLSAGQAVGYTVPGSAVNPTTGNKILESVAGKAAVGQEAALRNQPITDALARAEAGLPQGAALSAQTLKGARKAAAGPYRELTAISPQAAADMEALKAARLESKLNWQFYGRQGDPAAYKAATQADQLATSLENSLETQAQQVGRADLVRALRSARQQIAKIHDVEKALNVGTGSIDASVLGRMVDQGRPLSGGLKTIGDFQQAFKPYMREASTIPTPGVSKIAALLSGGTGAGGFAAGGPLGAGAAAIPFTVPPAARELALKLGKSVKPDYSVGALPQAAAALNDPATRRQLSMLLRAGTLPAIPQLTGAE